VTGPRVSIIVPTLNEASCLAPLLRRLQAKDTEVIVVDGGSSDGTVNLATQAMCRVLHSDSGRATQMNAGAASACGKWLWFVHADTQLLAPVEDYLNAIESGASWGFFLLKLSGQRRVFRLIEKLINWRSRFSSVATGDQGIFVRRELLLRQGGFAQQPLMEDVELSKRLRVIASANVANIALQTSSRRWEQAGVASTVLLMWRLRLLYFFGASPQWLARQYR
jgi:rSAM/selenodomain-associated transferase 2